MTPTTQHDTTRQAALSNDLPPAGPPLERESSVDEPLGGQSMPRGKRDQAD